MSYPQSYPRSGRPSRKCPLDGQPGLRCNLLLRAAADWLPPTVTMPRQTATVVTDGGHVGRVVITYVSEELRYRRDRRWVWLASRVDPAPPAT